MLMRKKKKEGATRVEKVGPIVKNEKDIGIVVPSVKEETTVAKVVPIVKEEKDVGTVVPSVKEETIAENVAHLLRKKSFQFQKKES